MKNFFSDLNRHLLVENMKKSFRKKGFLVDKIIIDDYSYGSIKADILTGCGNKIVVEEYDKKITWKLNNISMGEVIGNNICDVSGDYEYQMKKG